MLVAETGTSRKGVSNGKSPGDAQIEGDSLQLDIGLLRAAIRKLTLKETGELMRSIVRAGKVAKPNREQRMLLAIFAREEEPSCSK